MLNIAEASGWVAFVDSQVTPGETEDYRIVVIREADNEVIYNSSIPLARGLRTHGFEMSRQDSRLLDIAARVNAGILPPLSQFIPPAPAPEEAPAPAETVLETEQISVLQGVSVLSATESELILSLDEPGALSLGDRIFLRTSPEMFTDPASGASILLSRGRVAGLLEITHIVEDVATATLRSGMIPETGYLERARPDDGDEGR